MDNKEKREFEKSFGKSFVVGTLTFICGRCEIVLLTGQFRCHERTETIQCHGCNTNYNIVMGEVEEEDEKDVD